MGIPIHGKDGLYIETGPRLLCVHVVSTTVQLHAQNLPSYSELLTRESRMMQNMKNVAFLYDVNKENNIFVGEITRHCYKWSVIGALYFSGLFLQFSVSMKRNITHLCITSFSTWYSPMSEITYFYSCRMCIFVKSWSKNISIFRDVGFVDSSGVLCLFFSYRLTFRCRRLCKRQFY